jgi:hypothetical protein
MMTGGTNTSSTTGAAIKRCSLKNFLRDISTARVICYA